jgi:hypothetical protein
MRWGISDSMGALANDICIEEIRKCNQISYGPSFVVNTFTHYVLIKIYKKFKAFLSHRSGSRHLQPKIIKEDFEMIYNKVNEENKELLNNFYELDSNCIENPYYLLKNETIERITSANSKPKVKTKSKNLK